MISADVACVEELYDSIQELRGELQGDPFKLSWGMANKAVLFIKCHKREAAIATEKKG
jgi:hypothetical protein